VLDPFAGSNTTDWVAESMGLHWIAIERDQQYAEDSGLRFDDAPAESANGQGRLF
jgi:site-specific DNA-methyltransferase (cytosine-N4-specific)